MTPRTPAVRAAVRRGNQIKKLRTELRKLDDPALIKRLGKYSGLTSREIRSRNWGWNRLDRSSVIDQIVRYELPA